MLVPEGLQQQQVVLAMSQQSAVVGAVRGAPLASGLEMLLGRLWVEIIFQHFPYCCFRRQGGSPRGPEIRPCVKPGEKWLLLSVSLCASADACCKMLGNVFRSTCCFWKGKCVLPSSAIPQEGSDPIVLLKSIQTAQLCL